MIVNASIFFTTKSHERTSQIKKKKRLVPLVQMFTNLPDYHSVEFDKLLASYRKMANSKHQAQCETF